MLPLLAEFYGREPVLVARDLLGKLLVRRARGGLCIGRIVETEAYLAEGDAACHAARGKTRKNATMFGRAGLLYVYSIHARYCMNVVTEAEGVASAVLIRAVEPLVGVSRMEQRRGTTVRRDLVRGPARLCEAFDVDRRLDGWDLTRGEQIWVTGDALPPSAGEQVVPAGEIEIATSPRIGVTSAHDLELRFFLAGNAFVSGPRRRQRNEP